MAKARFDVRFSRAARRDIARIIARSWRAFGENAAIRYEALLEQAFADLGDDPRRPGSRQRGDLSEGVLVYPIAFSRQRARTSVGVVHNPRHLIVYRPKDNEVQVVRVLHDSQDISAQLPERLRADR